MSVQGPSSHPASLPAALPVVPRPAVAARPAAEPERSAGAVSLWDLLTPEERTFFQQLAVTGRLAYGPNTRADEPNSPAPIGQRIDVRG